MNEKQKVRDILQAFFDRRSTLQKDLQDLRLDTRYTAEYQAQMIMEKEKQIGILAEKSIADVTSIIQHVKESREKERRRLDEKAKENSFQACLDGFLHALTLGGEQMTNEQLLEVIRPYKDIPLAMAAIRGALEKGHVSPERVKGICAEILTTAQEQAALDKLASGLSSALKQHPVYGMNLESAACEILLSRWNDNLQPCKIT